MPPKKKSTENEKQKLNEATINNIALSIVSKLFDFVDKKEKKVMSGAEALKKYKNEYNKELEFNINTSFIEKPNIKFVDDSSLKELKKEVIRRFNQTLKAVKIIRKKKRK